MNARRKETNGGWRTKNCIALKTWTVFLTDESSWGLFHGHAAGVF